MIQFRARTPRWIIVVIDLAIAAFSLALSYLIRFDLNTDLATLTKEWEILSKSIVFYFLVKFVVFYLFKIHKGLLRHTSNHDIARIFKTLITFSLILMSEF